MIENKRAKFDYTFIETETAGLVLHGWEVKSLRAGKAQLSGSYVVFKDGEAFLFGALITPLLSKNTHTIAEPLRTRKLLLTRKQLNRWIGKVTTAGMTVVPVKLIKDDKNRFKLVVALAKGKKQHDKRAVEKDRDVTRELQATIKAQKANL